MRLRRARQRPDAMAGLAAMAGHERVGHEQQRHGRVKPDPPYPGNAGKHRWMLQHGGSWIRAQQRVVARRMDEVVHEGPSWAMQFGRLGGCSRLR